MFSRHSHIDAPSLLNSCHVCQERSDLCQAIPAHPSQGFSGHGSVCDQMHLPHTSHKGLLHAQGPVWMHWTMPTLASVCKTSRHHAAQHRIALGEGRRVCEGRLDRLPEHQALRRAPACQLCVDVLAVHCKDCRLQRLPCRPRQSCPCRSHAGAMHQSVSLSLEGCQYRLPEQQALRYVSAYHRCI